MNFSLKVLILFIMFFLHIFNDYNLQGILADMKQFNWWFKHPNYSPKYRYDYQMALLEHSFSWAFTITLPFLYIAFNQSNNLLTWILIISYITNTIFHAVIDDLKANKMAINLVEDQILHFIQIICTWIFMCAII